MAKLNRHLDAAAGISDGSGSSAGVAPLPAAAAPTPRLHTGMLTAEEVAACGASVQEMRLYLRGKNIRGSWRRPMAILQVRRQAAAWSHAACA